MWKKVMTASSRPRRKTPKSGKELDAPGLKLIVPVNSRALAVVGYRNFYPMKKLSRYDEDVAHKLLKLAEVITILIKDPTISKKPDFCNRDFKKFKSTRNVCELYKSAAK